MSKFKKIFFYPSILVLVGVNIIPLLGVLFWQWEIFSVIFLYWMESVVVGFFNILKMEKINKYKFTPMVPFFIVHYSIFMFVHLFFILQFFHPDLGTASDQFKAFAIVFKYLESLFISLSFLFLSHGMSFAFNFIKKQEFNNFSLAQQMFAPYKRVVIMQLVIILTGLVIRYNFDDQTVLPVIFLVVLKIIFDLGSHIFEHRKNILA